MENISLKQIAFAILSFVLPVAGIAIYYVLLYKDSKTAITCLWSSVAGLLVGIIASGGLSYLF